MLQCQKLKGFRGEEDLVLKTVVNIVLEMKKTTMEEKGRSMTAVELILQKFCPKSEGGGGRQELRSASPFAATPILPRG